MCVEEDQARTRALRAMVFMAVVVLVPRGVCVRVACSGWRKRRKQGQSVTLVPSKRVKVKRGGVGSLGKSG